MAQRNGKNTRDPRFCDIVLSNVPIVNLRWEFVAHYQLARAGKLVPARIEGPVMPFDTPYVRWKGMPNGGISLILLRTILSVEAYMCYAAKDEAYDRGLLDNTERAAARNPFILKGKGTADTFYNKLSSLFDAKLTMRRATRSYGRQPNRFTQRFETHSFTATKLTTRRMSKWSVCSNISRACIVGSTRGMIRKKSRRERGPLSTSTSGGCGPLFTTINRAQLLAAST